MASIQPQNSTRTSLAHTQRIAQALDGKSESMIMRILSNNGQFKKECKGLSIYLIKDSFVWTICGKKTFPMEVRQEDRQRCIKGAEGLQFQVLDSHGRKAYKGLIEYQEQTASIHDITKDVVDKVQGRGINYVLSGVNSKWLKENNLVLVVQRPLSQELMIKGAYGCTSFSQSQALLVRAGKKIHIKQGKNVWGDRMGVRTTLPCTKFKIKWDHKEVPAALIQV